MPYDRPEAYRAWRELPALTHTYPHVARLPVADIGRRELHPNDVAPN